MITKAAISKHLINLLGGLSIIVFTSSLSAAPYTSTHHQDIQTKPALSKKLLPVLLAKNIYTDKFEYKEARKTNNKKDQYNKKQTKKQINKLGKKQAQNKKQNIRERKKGYNKQNKQHPQKRLVKLHKKSANKWKRAAPTKPSITGNHYTGDGNKYRPNRHNNHQNNHNQQHAYNRHNRHNNRYNNHYNNHRHRHYRARWYNTAFLAPISFHFHSIGHHISVLPHLHTRLFVGGLPYFYFSGIFYERSGSNYVVVNAPVGAVVTTLPSGFIGFSTGPSTYYYVNDTYYTWHEPRQVYVVVNKPDGAEEAIEEATEGRLVIYPNENQDAEQQALDRYECHRWASTESGIDPTVEDVEHDSEEKSIYRRAISACMTGRDYTVT